MAEGTAPQPLSPFFLLSCISTADEMTVTFVEQSLCSLPGVGPRTLGKDTYGRIDGDASCKRVVERLLVAALEILVHSVIDGLQSWRERNVWSRMRRRGHGFKVKLTLGVIVVGRQPAVEVPVVDHAMAHILGHQDPVLHSRVRQQLQEKRYADRRLQEGDARKEGRRRASMAALESPPKLKVGQKIFPSNLCKRYCGGTMLSPANPPCATQRSMTRSGYLPHHTCSPHAVKELRSRFVPTTPLEETCFLIALPTFVTGAPVMMVHCGYCLTVS